MLGVFGNVILFSCEFVFVVFYFILLTCGSFHDPGFLNLSVAAAEAHVSPIGGRYR